MNYDKINKNNLINVNRILFNFLDIATTVHENFRQYISHLLTIANVECRLFHLLFQLFILLVEFGYIFLHESASG